MITPLIICSRCGEYDGQITHDELETTVFENLQDSIRQGAFIVADNVLIRKYLKHIPGTEFYDMNLANEKFATLIDYALGNRCLNVSSLPPLEELNVENYILFDPAKIAVVNSEDTKTWELKRGKRAKDIGQIRIVKLAAVSGKRFKKKIEYNDFNIRKGTPVENYLEMFKWLFEWSDYIDIYDRYAGSGVLQSGWPRGKDISGLSHLLECIKSKNEKIEKIRFFIGYDSRWLDWKLGKKMPNQHMNPEDILNIFKEITLTYGHCFEDVEVNMIPHWRPYWGHKRYILFRNSSSDAKYVISLDEGVTTFRTDLNHNIKENGEIKYKKYSYYDEDTQRTFKQIRINSEGKCLMYKIQKDGRICL